jgi:hypothetical protein
VNSIALRELISLLTCGDETGEALEALAINIENAESDPDLSFMRELDADAAWYRAVALQFALADYTVCSDKIDELHEQISEQFADPLPEFPGEFWGEPVDRYFAWLDGLIAARQQAQGGYQLLTLETGMDDNIVAFVVLRNDVPRILTLAAAGDLRIESTTSP